MISAVAVWRSSAPVYKARKKGEGKRSLRGVAISHLSPSAKPGGGGLEKGKEKEEEEGAGGAVSPFHYSSRISHVSSLTLPVAPGREDERVRRKGKEEKPNKLYIRGDNPQKGRGGKIL